MAHTPGEQKVPASQSSPPGCQTPCEEYPHHFSHVVVQEEPARGHSLCETAGSEVGGLGDTPKPCGDPHKVIECPIPRPARTWSEIVRGNFTCLPAAADQDRAEAKQERLDAKGCLAEEVDGKEACDSKSEKAASERPERLPADKKVQNGTFGSADFVIGTQACQGSAPAGDERVQNAGAGAGMPTSQGAKSDAESIHGGEELSMEDPFLPDHAVVDCGANGKGGGTREENACVKEVATQAPPGDCTCEKAAREIITGATAGSGTPRPEQARDGGSLSRVSKAKRGRRARRRNRKNPSSCPGDAPPKTSIRLHGESGNSDAACQASSKIHTTSGKIQEGVGDQGIKVEGGSSKLHDSSRADAMDLREKEQPVQAKEQEEGTQEGTGKGTAKGEGDGFPHADAARDSASETQQVPDPAADMSNEAQEDHASEALEVWPEKPPGLIKHDGNPWYGNKNRSRFHTQSGRRDKRLHRSASQNLPSVQQPEPIVLHPYTQGLLPNSDVHRSYREKFRNRWLGLAHEELEKRSHWPRITSNLKMVSTCESPWGEAFKSARVRLGIFTDEDGFCCYAPLHMPR